MYKIFKVFGFFLIVSIAANGQKPPKVIQEGKVFLLQNTLRLKLKPQFRNAINSPTPALKNALNYLSVNVVNKVFKHSPIPESTYNKQGLKLVDLSLIYEIFYTGSATMSDAISLLLNTGLFVCVEPHYVPQPLYTPNDPKVPTNQYYLPQIAAFQAWDVTKGDSNIVIGITDTGFDLDHPDHINKIKHNYSDKINAADDDNDGYIDNFTGWDLGDNDNNPTVSTTSPPAAQPFHGVAVSGIAAAETDNGVGVAGIGFKCTYLPIKIAESTNGYLVAAYEGIVYAADHGCTVINCSWGAVYPASQIEQDIVNYAFINKNALVTGACDDHVNQLLLYPAAYDNVFAVTAVTPSDVKSSYAAYATFVDLCAPGDGIYTAVYDDTYGNPPGSGNGTSFACPIVSAAAALIKSTHPNYTPEMIADQLKVTADIIDTMPQNLAYKGKLGGGRLNLFNAVSRQTPWIKIKSYILEDENDSTFVSGENVYLGCTFVNRLIKSSSSLYVVASSASPYVTISNSAVGLGSLNTYQEISNNGIPFVISLENNIPPYTKITIDFTFVDSNLGYNETKEKVEFIVEPDYCHVKANRIATTLTSYGRMAHNVNPPAGLGFRYAPNGSFASEIGLIIATDTGHVSDNLHTSATQYSKDFANVQTVRLQKPSVISAADYYQKYNDDSAYATKLGITVTQQTFAWNTATDNKYILVVYSLKNNSSNTYNNLYTGLFANWGITDSSKNKADWDSTHLMAYAYCPASNKYAGMALLSKKKANPYSIDVEPLGGGGIDISSVFKHSQKHALLTNTRLQAGNGSPLGGDIAQVLSSAADTLAPGDSIRIVYALMADDSLAGLKASADAALEKYTSIYEPSGISDNKKNAFDVTIFPNPAKQLVSFTFSSEITAATVEIIDITGRTVFKQQYNNLSSTLQISLANLPKGAYNLRLVSVLGNTTKFLMLE